MKNTELARVKGIEKYLGVMETVKPLALEEYSMIEASEYFGATRSQIRGYLQNYKDVIQDNVTVTGPNGKQKTIINKKGMFFIAILLSNKTIVSNMIFKAVEKAYVEDTVKATETTTKEEVSATATATTNTADKVKDKKEVVTVKVISIEDGKMCVKEEEMTIEEFEKRKRKSQEEAKAAMKDFFNELSEEKEEAKIDTDNVINFQDAIKKVLDKRAEKNNLGEELKERAMSSLKEALESLKDKAEELEDCECPECLGERLESAMMKKTFMHELEYEKIRFQESTVNLIFEQYMRRCEILGIKHDEAAILIQESLTNGKCADDLDSIILNKLVEKKELEQKQKRGSLRESINLLALEKFDGDHREAYHYLSNEMKFIIGFDMTSTRANSKQTPNSYLDMIMENDAWQEAMSIIHTLLAE